MCHPTMAITVSILGRFVKFMPGDIIDTAIDQWRKHLQACVRANGGHFEHLCEKTRANNLYFMCFGSSGICPWCQIFTVLMLHG